MRSNNWLDKKLHIGRGKFSLLTVSYLLNPEGGAAGGSTEYKEGCDVRHSIPNSRSQQASENSAEIFRDPSLE